MDDKVLKRDKFTSSLGIIAAAAGSAVGLGNIWLFPYITGKNGGGIFLLVYLVCVLVIGLPIMLGEFIIGRSGEKNMVGSLKALAPKSLWFLGGWFSIIVCFLILSFYSVVAGWSMSYVIKSIINNFQGMSGKNISDSFENYTSSSFQPVLWMMIFLGLTALIVIKGIKKGIEKFTKIFMPVLFIIIVILCIRVLFLPGAAKGLSFLFKPDWSKLSPQMILVALGTAFFSLGIGNGVMITYGSYIKKDINLSKTALKVSITDTLVAILGGIMIFPAVFSFGLEAGSGPGLVFVTLPNIFSNIYGGYFFQIIFFFLLGIAALTSSISTLEVIVAFLTEEFRIGRKKAVYVVVGIICALGIPCALSKGVLRDFKIWDKSYFDFIVWMVEAVFLPLGGLLVAIFVGWKLTHKTVIVELTPGRSHPTFSNAFILIIKYFVPIGILLIFLNGLGVF